MDQTPDNIILLPLPGLKRWDRNYRVGNVDAIVASIVRFGFNGALRVWKDGMVMAGNHSLIALQTIRANGGQAPHGIIVQDQEWHVPTVDVQHLSRIEAEAFAVADNRTPELAQNDPERLAAVLADIREGLGSLDSVGYTDADLDELLSQATRESRDELEDPGPEDTEADDCGEVRVLLGDIWGLGNNRLLCGDSTDRADVHRLFDGQKASLISTDPPYLVDYTGNDRPRDKGKDWSELYREIDIKDADHFVRSLFANALTIAKPDSAIYCWHAHKRAAMIEAIWTDLGIWLHQQIIWVKPVATLGYSFYPYRHEPCLMGWLQGHKPPHDGDYSHDVTSVWELDWEGKARLVGNDHPTQKPLEIFAIPMRKHTQPGDICFEPFSGSGSQLVAAEKEARRCYAIEIQPRFCEVGIRRWETMTGKAAELLERKT